MNSYLPFIVSGIATGSIYGLAATGLVLTYKTSGIFNFGHGAIATAAAYFFYFLHVEHGWDWVPAFVVAVVVAGPLLGLVMEPIARRLSQQRTAAKIVGTVGLILLVQGLGTIKYGPDTIRVPQFLPKGLEHFRLARRQHLLRAADRHARRAWSPRSCCTCSSGSPRPVWRCARWSTIRTSSRCRRAARAGFAGSPG